VKALAEPALAHRVIPKTGASIRGADGRSVVAEILMSVSISTPAPGVTLQRMSRP